jgi:hypothetical protein
MYGDPFVLEYVAIANGAPRWEKAFERYAIDYVVVSRDLPVRQILLAKGGFKLAYDDGHASVLLRDVPEFARFEDVRAARAPTGVGAPEAVGPEGGRE